MEIDSQASRPVDALLAAYCAGSLSPALHALVASHLAISSQSVAYAAALEGVLSASLSAATAPPMADRDGRLAAIFDAPPPSPVAAPLPCAVLPPPLRRLIGREFSSIKWRARLPGIRECNIALEGEGEASLLWIKAGRKIPFHTHEGTEVTLVLRGAFHDATGRYARGDLAIADAALDHQPVADAYEDCICFAVTDAPLRLTGPVGRIVERLFRRAH